LLVGRNGLTRLLEVKTGRGYTSPATKALQARWAENWKGAPVVVVRTVDEALEAMKP
jgi:hypothetical protein